MARSSAQARWRRRRSSHGAVMTLPGGSRLPWVRIDKEYRFETDKGGASLADLFGGRSPAPRLSFHVWARLHGGMSGLLLDRRRLQRLRSPPSQPRCHTYGGVAGSSQEAPGVPAEDGVDVPLGVIAWQRLQLRLKRVVHRGATAQGRH